MIQLGFVNNRIETSQIGFNRLPEQPGRKDTIITDNGEAHLLTIASTGAGKGRSNVIPACLQYKGSLVVLDPKGEAATVTANVRKKYGKVFIIDPFKVITNNPDRLNPFDMVLENAPPEQQGIMLAQAFQNDYGGIRDDPFWDYKANELLSALCIDELTRKKSFKDLRRRLHADDVDYTLAVMLDTKDVKSELARELISSYLQMPSEKTRPSVLAVAQQHLAILGDPAVSDSLNGPTSFDINAILRGDPVTIYLVIPPNKIKAYAALLRLWIVSFLYLLTERKERPAIPTLMIIDEAGNLGKMESLITSITLLRSYGLRVWTLYQDLSQMKQIYPNDWKTIINNCDVVQAFGVRTYLMAKEIGEVFGLSPMELLKLPPEQALLVRNGHRIEKMIRFDYLKDKHFRKYKFASNKMYAKFAL